MIKHSELVFGVPTVRSKQEEKYPDMGVITMLADAGKGTSKKLDLNTFLVDELELKLDGNDMVNFAFTMEEGEKVVYFANTTHIENPSNIRVTKQATLSNKKMYDYLAKVFDLDTTVDNELLISEISAGVGKVNVLVNDTNTSESNLAASDLVEEFNSPDGELVQEAVVITSDEDNHTNDVIVG